MQTSITDILKSGKFPPVIMLFGEEEFLLEEVYTSLIKKLIKNENDKFNFDMLDAEEHNQESIANVCSSFPMMSERRVVVLKRVEKLFSGRAKKNPKDTPLTKYIKSPAPSTVLIIKTHFDKLNGVTKKMKDGKIPTTIKAPFDNILEHHVWIEFPKVYESNYPNWIIQRFKKHGKTVEDEAIHHLIAQCGSSLRDLANEIDKILTYIKDKPVATSEDVHFLIGSTKKYNVFELQKAIGMRSLKQAIEIMEKMLHAERQEMLIIAMLTRYFVSLWKLYELSGKSQNQYQLAGQTGIAPFFISEYQATMRRYHPKELENAFKILCRTDEELKSTGGNSVLLMEKMLIDIIGIKNN